MEKEINKVLTEYIKENNLLLVFNIDTNYKKIIVKTQDIVLDVELLKTILLKAKIEKKTDYEYYYYIAPSCKYYISENIQEPNDLDLNFVYLLKKYFENKSSIYKYISILNELIVQKKVNLKEPSFYKYNTDEIKIFSKFFLYCANKKEVINFNEFIYFKYYDFEKLKDMKQKKELPSNNLKIVKLIDNFEEVLNFFEEIYDIKLINNLKGDIVEYDKIECNKLFFNEKENEFTLQMYVIKDSFKEICVLIKKIKEYFKDVKIILYVNENLEDFYNLFKDGFICDLIVKNPGNKNLLMLKNNKDLFFIYDNEIKESSEIILNQLNDIKKLIPDYFETLYLVFNIDNKVHKIKLSLDLSNFGYFIKDKAYQNYFSLKEYNEEKKNYSIYLYSKNNTLCYNIFTVVIPDISNILSHWLNYGNKKVVDNVDSLILINGYDLMLKMITIPQKKFYNKIIVQIDNYDENKDFDEALKKKDVEFHTKNIYFVKELKDFVDEEKIIPTTSLTTYNKRSFNVLLPFFDYVYKKKPILNKKPILLQVSYFLSYNLNVYGINNELDK